MEPNPWLCKVACIVCCHNLGVNELDVTCVRLNEEATNWHVQTFCSVQTQSAFIKILRFFFLFLGLYKIFMFVDVD